MKSTMKMIGTSSNAIFTFEGRCQGGSCKYSILSRNVAVRGFWSGFVRDCDDLDSCMANIVKLFLGLACHEEPTAMLVEQGDEFLLSPSSLWEWFLFWKRLYLPLPEYVKRRLVRISVYVVRYCLSLRKTHITLDPKLIKLLSGKEIATFILDEWVGVGVVGIMTTSDGNRTRMKEFCFQNTDLARIYCDFYESGVATVRASEFNFFADSFEDSLGDMAAGIHSYGDFSENTLFQQIKFYRETYLVDPYRFQKALRHVVGFYRYIINTERGCKIFDEGNFSASLIRNMSVLRFLAEGWDFVHYKAMEPSETRLKLVIVLKDLDRLGTRYVNGDALAFDLSLIESDFYRNLVWRHIRSDRTVLFSAQNTHYVAECLHLLERTKRKSGKKLTVLTFSEAELIRAFVLGKTIRDTTVYLILSVVRKFFGWANKENYILAETEATLNRMYYRIGDCSPSNSTKAIPREDYRLLHDHLAKEAELSYRAMLIFSIVHILAVTRFRPSQVCILHTQSIHMEHYKEYCFFYGVSKVSRGDKTWSLAPASVYQIVTSIINASSEMRERCYDPNIRDLVFLYETTNGFDVIRETDVKTAMDLACKALGLLHWTPYSLRKMHATVWDELDRQLGYHGELAAQAMGHKKYDTTRRHYIDRSFKEFVRVEGANLISTDAMMAREYEELMRNGTI